MKHTAHRIGEQKYEYRGWIIEYNYEIKKWFPISPDGDCDTSANTLREAKQDVDNSI